MRLNAGQLMVARLGAGLHQSSAGDEVLRGSTTVSVEGSTQREIEKDERLGRKRRLPGS
jgi:hypothetical protein